MPLDVLQITTIQGQLTDLGFRLFKPADMGRENEWFRMAIREFQIYARQEFVAVLANETADNWLDRLTRAPNQYPGRAGLGIDGKYADPVAQAIAFWVQHKYRCPVVVNLYFNVDPKAKWPPLDGPKPYGNYWRWDDPRIEAFVAAKAEELNIDHQRVYDRLQLRVADIAKRAERPTSLKIGRLKRHSTPLPKVARRFVGAALQDYASMRVEVLPDTLVGKTWAALLEESTKATFRVVRAISEQECFGFLDTMNGYDNAAFSLGPFHWTLSVGERLPPVQNPTEADVLVDEGELPALLAYWRMRRRSDFDRVLGQPFGLKVPEWLPDTAGPSTGWPAIRTYQGAVQLPGESGPVRRADQLAWFRTSHWYWRLMQAVMTEKSFREAQWDFSRLRIRDVLAFEFDPSERPDAPGTGRKVALAEIFRSEATVALLIRSHVRYSNFLTRKGFSVGLPLILQLSGIPRDLELAKWKEEAQQAALKQGFLRAASLGGLTAAQLTGLRALIGKPAELVAQLDAYVSSPPPMKSGGEAERLYEGLQKVARWPSASQFKWGPKKRAAPFALGIEACAPLATAPSFVLDASGLPPSPRILPPPSP